MFHVSAHPNMRHSCFGAIALDMANLGGHRSPLTSNRLGYQAESLVDRGLVFYASLMPAPSQPSGGDPTRGTAAGGFQGGCRKSAMHRRSFPDWPAIWHDIQVGLQ